METQEQQATEQPKTPPQATEQAGANLDSKEVPLPEKQEPDPQETWSKRFSALNRERKAAEQVKLEAKRLQAQIEAEKKQIEEEKKQIEQWKTERQKAKEQELASKDPIEKLNHEIAELRAQLEAEQAEKLKTKQQLMEEELNKTNQAAIGSIKKRLEAKPEYDALLVYGAENRIFQIIEEQYNKTGEVLQVEDVADAMMKEVEEQVEKLTKTNIFKTKYANNVKETPKTDQKTLSSAMTATVSGSENKGPLTDAERFKRALAALK